MISTHTKLSFIEERILKAFTEFVEKEVPEAVRIIIFGSRARGASNEESDLDVAVILNLSYVDKEMWNRLWDIKWRVLESLHAEEFPLSLSLMTLDDLSSKDFGIEKIIREEGIVIWEKGN